MRKKSGKRKSSRRKSKRRRGGAGMMSEKRWDIDAVRDFLRGS